MRGWRQGPGQLRSFMVSRAMMGGTLRTRLRGSVGAQSGRGGRLGLYHRRDSCVMLLCHHSLCSLLGPEATGSSQQGWRRLRTPSSAHSVGWEAGVLCSDHGPYEESSPRDGHENRSPLPQKEPCLPATGTSQTVVLDATCGPVGVGVQAACRGVGLKRAQWNSRDRGVEYDWGAPPGQAS